MAMSGKRGASRFMVTIGVAAATVAAALVPTSAAQAITGADFDPGFIISDMQFYDNSAMSEAQIQDFLNAVIAYSGGCATSDCLAVHTTSTFTRPVDRTVCAEYTGASNESTARIIYKVQRACGISARVILVTLQKEQSLLTASAPTSWQMKAAMGYGCPDSGTCDSRYYGIYNQIYNAAWQFKRYSTPDQWGNYQPGSEYIQYNPNPDCGGSWVNIRNNATAALYNYTPYQPNAASLADLDGSGGACGAHGNRNFWAYYNAWFGDPEYTGIPGVGVTRLDAPNRYDSSAMISQSTYSSTVPVVYVATGINYPDALTAGAAAARAGGPVLLTNGDGLRPSVDAEIRRLKPQRIVVVGGPESVSESLFETLKGYGAAVSRVGGADRYEVSRALTVAQYPTGVVPEIFIATGMDYPDALGAGFAAGYRKVPVLLIPGKDLQLDTPTIELLQRLAPGKITIVGGPASVSASIEAELRALAPASAVTRVGGAHRIEVSTNLARIVFGATKPTSVYLATGTSFPDALVGSVLAARRSAALLVSSASCVHSSTSGFIKDAKTNSVTLLGGPASLAANVKYMVNC